MTETLSFERQLYADLEELVAESGHVFTAKNAYRDGVLYRIYKYGLASFEDFKKPNALNCRGTMYNITDPQNPKLVCLPLPKFFNYDEYGTEYHNGAEVEEIYTKYDGSQLSTFWHAPTTGRDPRVQLKTKSTWQNEQVRWAEDFIEHVDNTRLHNELYLLAEGETTVNLEYTAPKNQVVVKYTEESLTVLSVRIHRTGKEYWGDELKDFLIKHGFLALLQILPKRRPPVRRGQMDDYSFNNSHPPTVVAGIKKETEGEGYVLQLYNYKTDTEYRAKVKTDRYTLLHKAKDGLQHDKNVFEAVIDEHLDDLKSLFQNDPATLARLEGIESRVKPKYNELVFQVERFVEENAGLTTKEFAIKAKAEKPLVMPLVMDAYRKIEPDYKGYAKKMRREIFGID